MMKTLNDFFDHIYCINLDRRPDRWEASQREFDRIGIEVERFSATDIADPLVNTPIAKQSKMLPGEVATVFSWIRVMQNAAQNQYSKVLILEDDIEFSRTFNKDWEAWHKEIPEDWQMLYLGGNLVGWKPSPVSEHVHRGEGIFAIHALGLDVDVCRELWLKATYHQQIDAILAQESTKYKSYIMIPRMAFQRTDYSDIQNRPANYWFLKTGQWSKEIGQ